MSLYCDLTSTIVKKQIQQIDQIQKQQEQKSSQNMRVEYSFQNNQILLIQNQNRQLRQKLAKKQQQIAYMSLKSIEMAKEYMKLLKAREQEMKQKDQALDKLVKKLKKYKSQRQQFKNKLKSKDQQIQIYSTNKQSIEDKFQVQIINIKQKNGQAIRKLENLKERAAHSPTIKQQIGKIVNQIISIMKIE